MVQVSVALFMPAHSPIALGYEPTGTDGNDQQHQADREQHRKRQAKQSIDVTVGLHFHPSWIGRLARRRRLRVFVASADVWDLSVRAKDLLERAKLWRPIASAIGAGSLRRRILNVVEHVPSSASLFAAGIVAFGTSSLAPFCLLAAKSSITSGRGSWREPREAGDAIAMMSNADAFTVDSAGIAAG